MAKTPNQSSSRKAQAASNPAAKSKSAAAAKPSKAATIIALLRRNGGASLDEMMSATGWQKHSVRGFLAGALKKQHGLLASSEKTDDGRVYRVAEEHRLCCLVSESIAFKSGFISNRLRGRRGLPVDASRLHFFRSAAERLDRR